MDDCIKAAFTAAGIAAGFLLPDIAQKLAFNKCQKKGKTLVPDRRYTGLPLKLLLMMLNGTAWLISSILSESILAAALVSLLLTSAVLIAVTDLRLRIIPNELVLFMAASGLAFQSVRFGFIALLTTLFSMAAMMVLFSAVAGFTGFDKVGAGDVKLAGVMGLALGYPGIITGLIVMSAAFLAFTAVGLFIKKLTLKTMVPFAPFMMTGMAVALLYIIHC